MNYIKGKKRSHLNLLNLENLLRIKDIGPKNVKEFDAHYYALECSKNHWLTDQSLFCFLFLEKTTKFDSVSLFCNTTSERLKSSSSSNK
jgi:hypothetical protein